MKFWNMIILDLQIQDFLNLINSGGIAGVCAYGLYIFLKIWRQESKENKETQQKEREIQRQVEKEQRELSQKERELYLNLLIKELQEQRLLTTDLTRSLKSFSQALLEVVKKIKPDE